MKSDVTSQVVPAPRQEKLDRFHDYLAQRQRDGINELPCLRIEKIERDVQFELVPDQFDSNGERLERGINYTADFMITYANGSRSVISVTSSDHPSTSEILKRKLMLYFHKLRVLEIRL